MSFPGSYYPLIGYRPLNENRWYRDTDHCLKVKSSEATKPKTIDAPPILPDKVSSLLERVAIDKEKRCCKKRFFKKVGKPKCIPCQKTFNGELQLNQHLKSDKHKAVLNNQSKSKICQDCDIKFEDWIHYQEHITSKKQVRNIEKLTYSYRTVS